MVQEISVEDAKAMRDRGDPLTIVDVREPWELDVAALEGAVSIPMALIPAHLDQLPRDHPLLVLCRSGVRSARVVEWLEMQGFPNALNIEGGILAWAQRLDPTIRQY